MTMVWTDLETTGLDPATNTILEVAMIVTDDDLNIMGQYTSLVLNHPPARLKEVYTIYPGHFENGLMDDLELAYNRIVAQKEQPYPTSAWVEKEICAVLEKLQIRAKAEMSERPVLAGSTVSFDRGFMKRYMPAVLDHLHYRNIDVSSIRELAKRWRPDLRETEPVPEKKAHRALQDILCSIDFLRHYRKKWLT